MRVLRGGGKCGASRGGVPNDRQTGPAHNYLVVACSLLQFLPAPQGTVRRGVEMGWASYRWWARGLGFDCLAYGQRLVWLCCLHRSRMLRLLASEQGTRRSAETDVRKLLGTFGRSALCGLARHISHFCLRKQDISRKLYGLQLSQDDVRCTPTMTPRFNTSFVWDGFVAPQLER